MLNVPARTFEDLRVWQKAHAFTLTVYRVTDAFPKYELYALTSQLRRAASSIPSNFVEGFRKRTKPDKIEIKKFDPVARKHVIYKETKIK